MALPTIMASIIQIILVLLIFDYNPNNVTMVFYVAGDKELAKGLQKNTGSTMEYVGAGDDAAMGVYKCSQCGSEVQNYEYYDFCPWCGRKIKEWK